MNGCGMRPTTCALLEEVDESEHRARPRGIDAAVGRARECTDPLNEDLRRGPAGVTRMA
jgi:hypothetical protein